MSTPPSASTPMGSPGSGHIGGSPTTWFIAEIQQMMFGFGDVKKPLAESANLVERIVRQQMITVLLEAVDVAVSRNARFVGIEDFLFLLRKDKVKLRRLIRYMDLKDLRTSLVKPGEEEDVQEQGEGRPPIRKRKKLCFDFINSIDQTGELLSVFEDSGVDEIKHQRLLRAELASRTMENQEYVEFTQARQNNFFRKFKFQRFKDWVMTGLTVEVKPNQLALEVLSYMAYETVAQIVDLSLIVKRDMSAKIDDPFEQLLPPVIKNHDQEPASGHMEPSTPTQTPPQTPTSPAHSGLSASLGSMSSLGGSMSSSKNKKRKKSGSSTVAELTTSNAIQPAEIREAMRRYSQSVGPFAPLRYGPESAMNKILSC
ncbi:unnamed protein product [Owenia fusiformis]|uniref:Transcription initiation protein SPT3 homolog n=1 Tax=Owenia fusiformis TaxID=6347 RepID=A0A8S4Q5Z0_OWEFU|nr:unnamed protein product [Owenia fusiformis]CAH1799773.1 unnamed protein product [Owenia fusiformis]